MNALLANLVKLLHVLFIAWVVITPFTHSKPLLVLHLIIVPFLWLHWAVNDDTCALTILECKLRGVDSSRSFFHRLVSPVYKISNADAKSMAWAASVVLWLLTARKVMAHPGVVQEVLLGRGA